MLKRFAIALILVIATLYAVFLTRFGVAFLINSGTIGCILAPVAAVAAIISTYWTWTKVLPIIYPKKEDQQ